MLRRAHRRLSRSSGTAALLQADGRLLPFATGIFDVILNCYMFDLLSESDIDEAIREFHRVLKSRGRLVLVTMAQQSWAVEPVWMWFRRHAPRVVGGCRPIAAAPFLTAAGWLIEQQERISQFGFRSELTLARPPVAAPLIDLQHPMR